VAATIAPETPLTLATRDELAELLTAVADRLEIEVDADRRARLERGRGLLERQLADQLAG
jgi:hypothetical protein